MLYFLNQNCAGLTLLANVIAMVISGGFAWYCHREKSKLAKEFEKYKTQLQVDFLKTDLKIKQLSSIYPKLFLRFKRAEERICSLCRDKAAAQKADFKKTNQAKILLNDATSYMVKNLLFISKEVETASDDLMQLMNEFEKMIAETPATNIYIYKQKVRLLTDSLQSKMQEELGNK